MPVYTYRCPCDEQQTFDVYLSFDNYSPTQPCPTCTTASPRVWGTSPVIFRPDGWDLHPSDPGYSKLPVVNEREAWKR